MHECRRSQGMLEFTYAISQTKQVLILCLTMVLYDLNNKLKTGFVFHEGE